MTAYDTTDGCPVVYPAGQHGERLVMASRFPATLLTRPAASLYGWVAGAVKRRHLRKRAPASASGATVISIGNIEVGGNGKTPFAIEVIRSLREMGHRPAYVSRGFGSKAERLSVVSIRLPDDDSSVLVEGVRVLRDGDGLATEIGDEGAMVASRCPQVPLVFARERSRAVQVAAHELGASHIILDDAFQSWRVPRDVDVVLVDGRNPFGNGRLVPAGTLRESPESLSRASMVGVNGADSVDAVSRVGKMVRAAAGWDVPVFGLARSLRFVGVGGEAVSGPQQDVASLSSIARPAGFDRLLAAAGAPPQLSIRYPDHHCYDASHIRQIEQVLAQRRLTAVVTTDKDWVKLREFDLPFACVRGRLEVTVFGDGVDPFSVIEKPQAMPAAL